ncbi:lysostaphin resistance A-like protein [Paenibacillus sp. NRS-1783]|uniref:CPBP family intramembrane glutamic endopeptidase n=1 Tax=unclassified Paenibacillus TaxID=185978 RepID=UPI003D2CF98D
MMRYGRHIFKNDFEHIDTKINRESIFNSFCFSIMGFSVLSKLSSSIITEQPTTPHIQTPIMFVYAIAFSPIFEELICRKYIFTKLHNRYNFWLSAILSSIIFAIPHFSIVNFLGYVFIGVVWSWYYKKTNNILVPICSHLLFNYFVILFMSLKG